MTAHRLAQLVFHPYKKLASVDDKVSVEGGLFSSKDLGERIAHQLYGFDASMLAIGFKRPDSTRVLVMDKPIFPDLAGGPFAVSYPVLNLWRGKTSPVIAMKPIFFKSGPVKDAAVLYHERAHSLLFTTYSEDAYVNHDEALQEALADFLTAHHRDNPRLGEYLGEDGLDLRNIETRTSSDIATEVKDSLLTLSDIVFHENSLFFSNLFWRLRSHLGKKAMNGLIKPLIDGLNTYRDSFDHSLEASNATENNVSLQTVQNIEYAMAVALKLSESPRFSTERMAIREAVREFAASIKYPLEKVERTAAALTPLDRDYSNPHPNGTLWQGIVVHSYGGAGFAVEAAAIGLLINSLFDGQCDPKSLSSCVSEKW
jgi:hypothetical protein